MMSLTGRFIDGLISLLVGLSCRVDGGQLAKVPMNGPLLLVSNHINFLEIPVLHDRLLPRKVIGFAKAEAWENRFIGWLFDYWGAIPVRRGEPDIGALRRTLDALANGGIVVIAPEGTRSRDGRLQRGQQGAAILALKSGAPVLPMAFYGGEAFGRNLRRLRRTPFHVRVGTPFRVDTGSVKPTREVREQITEQIMWQIASLLPESYRGVYADPPQETASFLRFDVAEDA